MNDVYDIDLSSPRYDSLEGVMGLIYPDLFNPSLEERAIRAFRSLLQLFTARLAHTTNSIAATNRRRLYRLLTHYLAVEQLVPEDITIITFNQDLQVEKTIELMSSAKRWRAIARDLFSFPHLYGADSWREITRPLSPEEVFTTAEEPRDTCMRVLKLHGSLNWYSAHDSQDPAPTAMFDQQRELRITQRRRIDPSMTLRQQSGSQFTLPVVVPPVNHKSAVLHDKLKAIWHLAERRLEQADELVIFGYSCPPLDFESSNLLRRAQRKRPAAARTLVIDPNGEVASRYIDVLEPDSMAYFPSAEALLRQL